MSVAENVALLAAQSLKHGSAACYVTRTTISAFLGLGSKANELFISVYVVKQSAGSENFVASCVVTLL